MLLVHRLPIRLHQFYLFFYVYVCRTRSGLTPLHVIDIKYTNGNIIVIDNIPQNYVAKEIAMQYYLKDNIRDRSSVSIIKSITSIKLTNNRCSTRAMGGEREIYTGVSRS